MIETLKQAKDFLRENFKKGCECPTCGQRVQLYKRKINSGMALFLIGLYRLDNRYDKENPGELHRNFFSNKEVMREMNLSASSLDYSVMKHFGLIEPRAAEGGKKNSGYWRLTHKGLLFTRWKARTPKYVFLYNNKIQGLSEETTTIKESLGDKFDFQELMNNNQ